MTPHQFVALFVRLFVILVACLFLARIPNTYSLFIQSNLPTLWIAVFLSLVFIVLILLWNFPLFISRKLLSNSIVQDTNSTSYQTWFEVGTLLLGLWLLVDAIPYLAQYATLYVFVQNGGIEGGMPNDWNATLVGVLVKITLSFALLLNASAIEKIIRKLRGR